MQSALLVLSVGKIATRLKCQKYVGTQDLNVEKIRVCTLMFGTLTMSIYSLPTVLYFNRRPTAPCKPCKMFQIRDTNNALGIKHFEVDCA